MAETFISKRAIFPYGLQRKFLYSAKNNLAVTWNEMASILKISPRTLTDWKREKFYMSWKSATLLSSKSRLKLSKTVEARDAFWYVHKGARLGGLAHYKKYGSIGNPEKRKAEWRKWWMRDGRFLKTIWNAPLPFKKAKKSSDLAEFIGIVMGDGGISEYQISITLHHQDDLEYKRFVVDLIKNLFGITPAVYHDVKNSVNNIVISRKKLVEFCVKELGLKRGNKIKQQIDIPIWIKINHNYQIACARGLFDTDGSVVKHKYLVNGKLYSYKKLQFTTLSKPLLFSMYKILRRIKLNPRLARGKEICIDSKMYVQRYFNVIGSHNPKHLNRYKN